MRQVGDSLERQAAEKFQGFLVNQGTESILRDDEGDRVSVWVLDEDRIPAASEHYVRFIANPSDPAFAATTKVQATTSRPADRARVVDVRNEVFRQERFGTGNVTFTLIVISIALTLASKAPNAAQLIRSLYYSEFMSRQFPEIMSGQVWRLVTPIFLHAGLLHLVFNMMWLHQLGGAIERNEGSRYFLFMTLLTAIIVNTSQYLISGPLFLGMSGVVYMLFGYVWMMSKYKAGSSYALNQQTVVIMLVWLVVCLVGLIPNTANTQHVMGLITGVAWGFLRSGQISTIRRRRRFRSGR